MVRRASRGVRVRICMVPHEISLVENKTENIRIFPKPLSVFLLHKWTVHGEAGWAYRLLWSKKHTKLSQNRTGCPEFFPRLGGSVDQKNRRMNVMHAFLGATLKPNYIEV